MRATHPLEDGIGVIIVVGTLLYGGLMGLRVALSERVDMGIDAVLAELGEQERATGSGQVVDLGGGRTKVGEDKSGKAKMSDV